jgi:hypothetical protein
MGPRRAPPRGEALRRADGVPRRADQRPAPGPRHAHQRALRHGGGPRPRVPRRRRRQRVEPPRDGRDLRRRPRPWDVGLRVLRHRDRLGGGGHAGGRPTAAGGIRQLWLHQRRVRSRASIRGSSERRGCARGGRTDAARPGARAAARRGCTPAGPGNLRRGGDHRTPRATGHTPRERRAGPGGPCRPRGVPGRRRPGVSRTSRPGTRCRMATSPSSF